MLALNNHQPEDSATSHSDAITKESLQKLHGMVIKHLPEPYNAIDPSTGIPLLDLESLIDIAHTLTRRTSSTDFQTHEDFANIFTETAHDLYQEMRDIEYEDEGQLCRYETDLNLH